MENRPIVSALVQSDFETENSKLHFLRTLQIWEIKIAMQNWKRMWSYTWKIYTKQSYVKEIICGDDVWTTVWLPVF